MTCNPGDGESETGEPQRLAGKQTLYQMAKCFTKIYYKREEKGRESERKGEVGEREGRSELVISGLVKNCQLRHGGPSLLPPGFGDNEQTEKAPPPHFVLAPISQESAQSETNTTPWGIKTRGRNHLPFPGHLSRMRELNNFSTLLPSGYTMLHSFILSSN